MITTIIKRDGKLVDYNPQNILNAVLLAVKDGLNSLSEGEAELYKGSTQLIPGVVLDKVEKLFIDEECVEVEKLQDVIITVLKDCAPLAAEKYSEYRDQRTKVRQQKTPLMKKIKEISVKTDRDNANVGNNFSAKLLRIASESNKESILSQMPTRFAIAHQIGDIHMHDLDSYNLTVNCLHLPVQEVLERGFDTGYGHISEPKRIESAAELICILIQAEQNDQFGGVAVPNLESALYKYALNTKEEIEKDMEDWISCVDTVYTDEEEINITVTKKLNVRVHQAMQAICYNLNSMHSRAGSQVPFSSINMGLPTNDIEAMIARAFLEEFEKGMGYKEGVKNGSPFIFPNIIFRIKDGVNYKPSDPYYDLYQLACRVASKRMNPTFMNIDSSFNKPYYEQGINPATMGCRTYLMSNRNGEPGVEGRGNIAPVTMNLPRLGIKCMNIENEEQRLAKFFDILDDMIDLCKDQLLHRYSVLKNLTVSDLPFAVGQGMMKGSEGLQARDSIEPILKQGTWGIGFIGLAETLVALIGEHHGQSEKADKLGYDIITHLRERCDQIGEEYKLNVSAYGTPAEGLSGRFTPMDIKRFGIIEGVTDKDYYTNSSHVPVNYPILITKKIEIESKYHKLENAGHIMYVELDDYPSEDIVQNIIDYAHDNADFGYMGINFHVRYCKGCGSYLHGENVCPKCGGYEIQGISRVTGYLSLDERFGVGKAAERADRTAHNTSTHMKSYNL